MTGGYFFMNSTLYHFHELRRRLFRSQREYEQVYVRMYNRLNPKCQTEAVTIFQYLADQALSSLALNGRSDEARANHLLQEVYREWGWKIYSHVPEFKDTAHTPKAIVLGNNVHLNFTARFNMLYSGKSDIRVFTFSMLTPSELEDAFKCELATIRNQA